MNVAGRTHRLTDKEIAKCFVYGLKPDVFRKEMYWRTLETLEDFIREAREDLSTHRDILEISDKIKKVEPKKDFSKPRKDFTTAVSNFNKGDESTFPARASPEGFEKSRSTSPRVDDLKDVE